MSIHVQIPDGHVLSKWDIDRLCYCWFTNSLINDSGGSGAISFYHGCIKFVKVLKSLSGDYVNMNPEMSLIDIGIVDAFGYFSEKK